MNRKDFILKSCAACIGTSAFSLLFSSCAPTRFTNGSLTSDGILIDVKEFAHKEKNKYRQYIVVRNDALLFPICVYRFSNIDYTAIWLQCAHQGAELNVVGNFLQCPAHGSEFNNRGEVTAGPADSNLRTFPVTINSGQLFIDLRKA